MAFCFELFLEKFKDFTYFKYKEICDITSDGLIISKILDNAAELFYKDNIGYVDKNKKLLKKHHILRRIERLFPLYFQINNDVRFGKKIINKSSFSQENYLTELYTIMKDKIFKIGMIEIKIEEYEYIDANSQYIFITNKIGETTINIYVTSFRQYENLLKYFDKQIENRKIMYR